MFAASVLKIKHSVIDDDQLLYQTKELEEPAN
jgi:hypothetical protein